MDLKHLQSFVAVAVLRARQRILPRHAEGCPAAFAEFAQAILPVSRPS